MEGVGVWRVWECERCGSVEGAVKVAIYGLQSRGVVGSAGRGRRGGVEDIEDRDELWDHLRGVVDSVDSLRSGLRGVLRDLEEWGIPSSLVGLDGDLEIVSRRLGESSKLLDSVVGLFDKEVKRLRSELGYDDLYDLESYFLRVEEEGVDRGV